MAIAASLSSHTLRRALLDVDTHLLDSVNFVSASLAPVAEPTALDRVNFWRAASSRGFRNNHLDCVNFAPAGAAV